MSTDKDLAPHARAVGVVAWCSFLVAGAATMVVFAFVDPQALQSGGEHGAFWANRLNGYALGFFIFWLATAASGALTLYMIRTERSSTERA